MLGIIYKITNKTTGTVYIGQTIQKLSQRWKEHCSTRSKNRFYLAHAIKKYGKENFDIKIIAKCNSIDEMNHREQYYIKLFNTLAPNGYNLTLGGGNAIPGPETRKKMSDKRRGSRHHYFGKKRSKEDREKISKGKMGFKHSENTKKLLSTLFKGRKKTNIHKNKISKALLGRKQSKAHIENNAQSRKGKKASKETCLKLSKPVFCLENGFIFKSIQSASDTTGIDISSISRICKGKQKTSAIGLSFKYIDNYSIIFVDV